jgi:hypothetical protein
LPVVGIACDFDDEPVSHFVFDDSLEEHGSVDWPNALAEGDEAEETEDDQCRFHEIRIRLPLSGFRSLHFGHLIALLVDPTKA